MTPTPGKWYQGTPSARTVFQRLALFIGRDYESHKFYLRGIGLVGECPDAEQARDFVELLNLTDARVAQLQESNAELTEMVRGATQHITAHVADGWTYRVTWRHSETGNGCESSHFDNIAAADIYLRSLAKWHSIRALQVGPR